MDIKKICDAFSDGLRDANSGNKKVKLENFNLQDAYDYGYDLHMENKRPSFNYYYYTKYNLDPKQYEKEQKVSLKQSEKAVELARQELEKAIEYYKKVLSLKDIDGSHEKANNYIKNPYK